MQPESEFLHAVVLERCLPDSFELKNSYPDDPIITIPKFRKTYNQHHIKSIISNRRRFNFHSRTNIDWNTTPDDWLLSDEGYSLSFRVRNPSQNLRQNFRQNLRQNPTILTPTVVWCRIINPAWTTFIIWSKSRSCRSPPIYLNWN